MGDKVISVNSQGFFGGDVNEFARYHKPLALVVTEHKQRDLGNLDVVKGYTLANGYPASTGQRGVGVFVKNGVDYKVRRDLDSFAREKRFEVASVEIPSRNLVVTGKYRSPNSSKTAFNNSLDNFARYINNEPHKKHVIAGDINIDSRKNTVTKEVIRDNGLKFNLRSSTHEKNSCLDNFITDFQPVQTRVMKAKSDKISDHHPIEMRVRRSTAKPSTSRSSRR